MNQMTIATMEILFKQLRNLPPRHSARFIKWLKGKYPNHECHHLLGSMGSLKLNDFLAVPVTREEHIKADANRIDFLSDNLAESLNLIFEYIEFIENKL